MVTPVDMYARYPTHVRRIAPHVGAIIVGCGGIGTWVAIGLAMAGVSRLVLIDGDDVEPSNLGRLPYPREWVGRNKAAAAADFIADLRDCVVLAAISPADEDGLTNLVRDVQHSCRSVWVVDCSDNFDTQRMTHSVAQALGVRWLRVGANDGYVTSARSLPWGEHPHDAGYNVVWVADCYLAAATALRVVFTTTEDDVMADTGDADDTDADDTDAGDTDADDTDAGDTDADDTDAGGTDADDTDADNELYFDWADALRVNASERAPAASGLTFTQAAALCAAWEWQGPSPNKSWEWLVLVGGNL